MRSNAVVIGSVYAAFQRGDMPSVLAAMDPGIVWNEAEDGAAAKATGAKIKAQIRALRLKDGKIVALQPYADTSFRRFSLSAISDVC